MSANSSLSLNGLSPKQLRAAVALGNGRVDAFAAARAGVSVRSVRRWKAQNSAFRNVVRGMSRKTIEAATEDLNQAITSGFKTLRSVCDSAVLPALRLKAADLLLKHALRMKELTSIEDRLAKLEAGSDDDDETD